MKVYKGYELIKLIKDRELKIGSKFIAQGWERKPFEYKERGLYFVDTLNNIFNQWNLESILDMDFELLEDEKDEIDIDSIEELENEVMRDDWRYYVPMFFNKINELVQEVNQLKKRNKRVKRQRILL